MVTLRHLLLDIGLLICAISVLLIQSWDGSPSLSQPSAYSSDRLTPAGCISLLIVHSRSSARSCRSSLGITASKTADLLLCHWTIDWWRPCLFDCLSAVLDDRSVDSPDLPPHHLVRQGDTARPVQVICFLLTHRRVALARSQLPCATVAALFQSIEHETSSVVCSSYSSVAPVCWSMMCQGALICALYLKQYQRHPSLSNILEKSSWLLLLRSMSHATVLLRFLSFD